MRHNPTVAQRLVVASFPKIDQEVINRPDVALRLQRALLEATRPGGGRGFAEDMRVVLNPWNFDPAEIVAMVFVFHGRRDVIAPPSHAEHWIETLPNARPVWFEDAGHSLIEDHVEAILDCVSAHSAITAVTRQPGNSR